MARPIADTPVLAGKDARRFREAMENVKPISQAEREEIKQTGVWFRSIATTCVW
jgi:hypothetical protein